MTTNKDHIEMAFKSANAFADDGKLDAQELTEIVDIAEGDPAMKAKLAELLDKLKPQA
jgi:hypothetical protein